MNIFKKILSILLILLTFLVLFRYRTVPSGRLWDNYTVMYVPVSSSDAVISDVFREFQIEEYVSLDNQRVPVLLKNGSVEKAMFNLNGTKNGYNYLRERENYFFDSSKQYRLYYVQNDYKEQLNDAVKYLEKNEIEAGIDSSFSYPWILPIVALLYTVILFWFAKYKKVFGLSCISSVVFVFTNPFYACAIAAMMFVTVLFFISNIWVRPGAINRLLKSPQVYLFTIIPIVLSFSNTKYSGIFFLVVMAVSFALILLCRSIHIANENKTKYQYIYILSAKKISLYSGKKNLISLLSVIGVALVFGYFFINSSDNFNGRFAKVLLPGKSSIASKELSTMDEFYKWNWGIFSYPYRSLNKNGETNTVVYPRYEKEDGIIKRFDEIMRFDDKYKQSVLDGIDNLDFFSIEQVIKSQGSDLLYGYTASSSYNVSIFTIILMILSLSVLIFIYISAIIRKGGTK